MLIDHTVAPRLAPPSSATGSPAVQALVIGHLNAGRPEMARLALELRPAFVAALDAWFAREMERASDAGAAAALAALLAQDGRGD